MSLCLFAAVWIHVDASSFVREQEMREHWSTGQTSKRSVEIDAWGASMANTTRGLDNETMLEANSLCANLRDIIYSRGLSNDQRHMCWPIFLNNIDAAKSYREAMLFAVSIDKKALSLAKKKINNTMTKFSFTVAN